MKSTVALTVLSLAFVPLSATVFADSQPASVTEASEEVDAILHHAKPSVVRIEVVMEQGAAGRMKKQRGFGSGAIISEEGHVLTNHHVAGRGTRFRVTLPNREVIPAYLIGTDALTDLSIIQLDLAARRHPGVPVSVIEFGDSEALETGDTVYALGSPAALSQSVTKGIVANTAMIAPPLMRGGLMLDGESVGEVVRWIGHDAVIFGGNSGGPLVDSRGRLIGVNEVGIGSLGGAIPGNLAREIANELIEHGEVERGSIGLEFQELLIADAKKQGVRVGSVFQGSPAARAGLQPGDFIHQIDGEKIADCRAPEDLPPVNVRIFSSKPGTTLRLAGERDGQAMSWTCEVAKRAAVRSFEDEFPRWGFTARDLTPMDALRRKRENSNGLILDTIRLGGPAAQAKPSLAKKDIITRLNGQPINGINDYRDFLAQLPENDEPQPILVEFERGVTHEQFLTVVEVGPERSAPRTPVAPRGWLGVRGQELGSALADAMNLADVAGVRITRIIPQGPAHEAGLLNGDILVALDGKPLRVRRPEDLQSFFNQIQARDPGTELVFGIIRGHEELSIPVTLSARPSDEENAEVFKSEDFEFSAIDLTDNRRDSENLPASLAAARVTAVTSNGWAALAGLRKGDLILAVNESPISGISALEEALESMARKRSERAIVSVQRGIRHLFLEFEPAWDSTN